MAKKSLNKFSINTFFSKFLIYTWLVPRIWTVWKTALHLHIHATNMIMRTYVCMCKHRGCYSDLNMIKVEGRTFILVVLEGWSPHLMTSVKVSVSQMTGDKEDSASSSSCKLCSLLFWHVWLAGHSKSPSASLNRSDKVHLCIFSSSQCPSTHWEGSWGKWLRDPGKCSDSLMRFIQISLPPGGDPDIFTQEWEQVTVEYSGYLFPAHCWVSRACLHSWRILTCLVGGGKVAGASTFKDCRCAMMGGFLIPSQPGNCTRYISIFKNVARFQTSDSGLEDKVACPESLGS